MGAGHLPARLRPGPMERSDGLGRLSQGRAARVDDTLRRRLRGAAGPDRDRADLRRGRSGAAQVLTYDQAFDYQQDTPPTFMSFSLGEVQFQDRAPSLAVSLIRPDGNSVVLYRASERGPRPGEQPPYVRNADEPERVLLSAEETHGAGDRGHARQGVRRHGRARATSRGTRRRRSSASRTATAASRR